MVAFAGSASAQSGEVRIDEEFQDVIEGDSVPINVSFTAGEQRERVTVTCDSCPMWERHVDFDEAKGNCETTDAYVDEGGAEHSERVCRISFPEGFTNTDGGPPPANQGQPASPTTYDVRLGPNGERSSTTFEAHLSSASTCRPDPDTTGTGVARRSDVVMLSTSGHPEGETATIRVRDGADVFFERSFTSAGANVAYHFRWKVPLDLPIQGSERTATILVDGSSGGEREEIVIRPGVARPVPLVQPGSFGQPVEFNRTEEVQIRLGYEFLSAPIGCRDVSADRDVEPITADQVGEDTPNVLVRRLNDPPTAQPVQTVDTTATEFGGGVFLVNYTIDRDEQATNADESDPVYDIVFERTRLADGNYIGRYNSTNYEVYPYTIEPEFALLQDEVERLETAQLVLNLTYADGSPFTPQDTDQQLEIAFGQDGQDPQFTFEANHRGDGIWNVSQPLGFEYEPLGEYTWRIQETPDNNGAPGEENRVPETVTEIVDVVSARPRLNMTAIVDDEAVDGAERTDRVSVRVDARFRNGVPLTEENIDPSMGGIELDINKRNEFGRVVDQERRVLAHAGDGVWVESFTVGRSPSNAPTGEWELRLEARDDRSPPNENVTSFPFQVEPGTLSVTDTESPPQLVNGSEVNFRFRLHYPDGSLATERLMDSSRGGELDVTLERVSRADRPAIVEREVDPRPVSGGQAWQVSLNASKIVPGNHFFNVTGQDIHGNVIEPHASDLFTVMFNGEFRNSTTPICPDNATGGCDVERGDTVYVVFPGASGDKGMLGERPDIRVHRQDPDSGRWVLFREDVWLSPQQFFNLTGRDVGDNHVGRFVTEESTPADTYRLVILGRNQDDTGFAGFSQTFNVSRVPVEREVVQPFPDRAQKTEEIAARIENEPGDVIDSTVVEVGPVTARNVQIDQTGVGTFARWQAPSGFPTGPASFTIEGRDLFGNPFTVELGPVQLQPVEIRVQQDGSIPEEASRGEQASFDVQMTYETGSSFEAEDGEPDVIVVDEQGNKVDEGDALHRVGSWEIRWSPRADLPPGSYRVVVTGTDDAGNVVEDFRTDPITVTSGTVSGSVSNAPADNVVRGATVTAEVSFPTEIQEGQATVTTGTDAIGEPQVSIEGSTVQMAFPTDRSTELVDAFFSFTGTDVVGNNLTAETDRFSVRAQTMSIEWVQQPPQRIANTETVQAAFTVEYPDGSYMRPGEGTPIVGLFVRDQPSGQIDATPSEDNPAVWEVEWEPPEDARTDFAYYFSASARDQFRNEAPPVSSRGFLVQNPVVPDYVPAPSPSPAVVLAMLAGLAAALRRYRS